MFEFSDENIIKDNLREINSLFSDGKYSKDKLTHNKRRKFERIINKRKTNNDFLLSLIQETNTDSDLNTSRLRVIKWTTDKHASDEIDNWDEYLDHDLPNPNIKLDYKFLGYECIVMKLLKKIEIINK